MARYYQRPNNPIVDLTPKVPIEFYSNLINQAQQNLNQANVTGAAFMTDAYNQKFVDQAARDRAMALGQAPIEQALDRDFVTPAAMAKAVTQASAAMADWKNVNAKHLELVEREQKLRDTWGGNYIGNSVKSMSLINPETGEFIKPEDIKLTASNREDLVQALAKDNAGRADLKREIEGNWKTILGGKAFEKKNRKVTGLTEQERVAEFVNNQAMAKQYLAQMPEFAAAIAASGVDPVDYMTKEIDQWSKQLVKGEDFDSKYLDNPDYKAGGPDFPPNPPGYRVTPFTTSVEKVKEDVDKVKELMLGKGKKTDAMLGRRVTEAEKFVEVSKEYGKLVAKYPHIEDEARRELYAQGIRGTAGDNKSLVEFNKQVRNLTLNKLKQQASENALVSDYAIDFQDESFELGVSREIATNISRQGLSDVEVFDNEGNSVKLGDLYKKDPEKVYAQPNASGTFSLYKDGKTYQIPTHDRDGAPLNIVNQDATRTSNLMGKVFANQYKITADAYEPVDLGYSIQIPIRTSAGVSTIVGNPVYQYQRGEGGKNVLYRYVVDSNGDPYTVNGQVYVEPVSIGEFQKNAATAMYHQLNVPEYRKN